MAGCHFLRFHILEQFGGKDLGINGTLALIIEPS